MLKGHKDAVTLLAWSPNGSLLASAAGGSGSKDPTIRLWKANGTLVAVLRGHSCGVMSMAWSPDGGTLASGSCDGTARLWRTDGTLVRTIIPRAGGVMAAAWSPDGKVLATGSVAGPTSNTVHLWDAGTGALLRTLRTLYSGGKFYRLGWSKDGMFLVGGATDYREWRADGTQVFTSGGCASCTPAWGFAWSPDGRIWGIGDESGNVSLYGTDGTPVTHMSNSEGNVDVMAWSPDGKVLAGGNTLWRLTGGEAIVLGSLGGGRVVSLAWSPTSTVIATAFLDDRGVDLRGPDGTLLGTLTGHTRQVSLVAWSPDGGTLASASSDRTIRLWALGSWVSRLSL